MIERAAVTAGLGPKAHPHMLRHACGYALANKGARYQGDPKVARSSLDYEHGGLYGPGAKPALRTFGASEPAASQGGARLCLDLKLQTHRHPLTA